MDPGGPNPVKPPVPLLDKEPLFRQVRGVVLDQILRGELPPGTRLTVSRMADLLKVSRTPVREALLHLLREGFLTLEQNRGFLVVPLRREEIRELYTVLHAMEDLALWISGLPNSAELAQLADINGQLAKCARNPEQALKLNDRWHRVLVQRCKNTLLLELIGDLRLRSYRYEYWYYVGGAGRITQAASLHHSLVDALEAGDLEKARRQLRKRYLGELETMLPKIAADPGMDALEGSA